MKMVTKAPLKMPAAPAPHNARPTMKEIDVGAKAESKDPTSKMKKEARNMILVENIE
jgi:hypothetical protein